MELFCFQYIDTWKLLLNFFAINRIDTLQHCHICLIYSRYRAPHYSKYNDVTTPDNSYSNLLSTKKHIRSYSKWRWSYITYSINRDTNVYPKYLRETIISILYVTEKNAKKKWECPNFIILKNLLSFLIKSNSARYKLTLFRKYTIYLISILLKSISIVLPFPFI